ncbi:ankyrin repeat domain-containing protein [Legionella shakespearei]|uniref:Ankyrin repeats (3 copies) n=1 Tax=Legionella shakespearei DSM 23087 TaxID=1122169 RepID=A0A0W0YTV3_9GAMM|nr:ankyrin repeat domain-containing protein [Legionella shakespearei]KTD59987.1 Ankyrin repeats (3 copies) [Legionella shakespearei DSM 23087]
MNLKTEHPIFLLASQGKLAELKSIIVERNELFHLRASNGFNLMEFAAENGHVHVMMWLFENNVPLTQKGSTFCNSLLLAASKGHLPAVQWLISKNLSLDELNSALIVAVNNNHCDVVSKLITSGASIDVLSRKGQPLAMEPVRKGYLEMLKCLYQNGVSMESKNSNGHTLLMEAASYGHMPIVKWLVQEKVNINTSEGSNYTALMYAARDGNFEILKYLYENGALITSYEVRDYNYNRQTVSPISIALENNHPEIAEFVFEKAVFYPLPGERRTIEELERIYIPKDATSLAKACAKNTNIIGSLDSVYVPAELRAIYLRNQQLNKLYHDIIAIIDQAEITPSPDISKIEKKIGEMLKLPNLPTQFIQLELIYKRMIGIYISAGQFDRALELLENCSEKVLKDKLRHANLLGIAMGFMGQQQFFKALKIFEDLPSSALDADAQTLHWRCMFAFIMDKEYDHININLRTLVHCIPAKIRELENKYPHCWVLILNTLTAQFYHEHGETLSSTLEALTVLSHLPKTPATSQHGRTLLQSALSSPQQSLTTRTELGKNVFDFMSDYPDLIQLTLSRFVLLPSAEQQEALKTISNGVYPGVLFYAASEQPHLFAGLIRLLLSQKDSALLSDILDTKDNTGRDALILAAQTGTYEVIPQLQNLGFSVHFALYTAASLGLVDALPGLLAHGASLETTDEQGYTVLYHAIEQNQENAIDFLLNAGADIRHQTQQGKDALGLSIMHLPAIPLPILKHVSILPIPEQLDVLYQATGNRSNLLAYLLPRDTGQRCEELVKWCFSELSAADNSEEQKALQNIRFDASFHSILLKYQQMREKSVQGNDNYDHAVSAAEILLWKIYEARINFFYDMSALETKIEVLRDACNNAIEEARPVLSYHREWDKLIAGGILFLAALPVSLPLWSLNFFSFKPKSTQLLDQMHDDLARPTA